MRRVGRGDATLSPGQGHQLHLLAEEWHMERLDHRYMYAEYIQYTLYVCIYTNRILKACEKECVFVCACEREKKSERERERESVRDRETTQLQSNIPRRVRYKIENDIFELFGCLRW